MKKVPTLKFPPQENLDQEIIVPLYVEYRKLPYQLEIDSYFTMKAVGEDITVSDFYSMIVMSLFRIESIMNDVKDSKNEFFTI